MSGWISIAASLLVISTLSAADGIRLDVHGDPLPEGAIVRYGMARLRHPCEPSQLTFSPDGRRLVSVGGQPKSCVVVWDTTTGKSVARLEGNGFAAAAFGPNGIVYVAGSEPTCVAWDPSTGKSQPLAAIKVDDQIRIGRAVCVSPDGQTIAVGCNQGMIVWLDAMTGQERGRFVRRDQPDIEDIQYAGHGRIMAVRAATCDIFLVDAQRHRALRSYMLVNDYYPTCTAMALNRDGTWLATSVNRYRDQPSVQLVDTNSDEQASSFTPPAVRLLAAGFTPDGATLHGLAADGKLYRWRSRDGKELLQAELGSEPSIAAFQPDGKRLALADKMGFIRLFDSATGKPIVQESPAKSLASITAGGKDGKLVISSDVTGKLDLWDRDTGKHQRTIANLDGPCLSPDGERVASWNPERTSFTVFNAATGKAIWQSSPIANGLEIIFSPDSRLLATVRQSPAAIDIWDVRSGRLRSTLKPPTKDVEYQLPHLSWSPDARNILAFDQQSDRTNIAYCIGEQRRIVLNREFGDVCVWEVATGQLRWAKPVSWIQDQTLTTAWFHAGSKLVMIHNRVLSVYRVGSSVPMSEILIPADPCAAAVSTDSRWIAVGFKNGSIKVWDSLHAAWRIATGHGGAIAALTFLPDSNRLLSGSADGTGLLWDVTILPNDVGSKTPVPGLDPEKDWAALGTASGQEVMKLFERFENHPAQTVRLFRDRIKPAVAPTAEHLSQLIQSLGDAKFAVREKARLELLALGEQAEPLLRQAAEKPANTEAKKRIDGLLEALSQPTIDPNLIRLARAVELLGILDTPDARDLLKTLSKGDPAARLTKDAAASLKH